MRVGIKQFLSNKHSWGVVGTSIAKELISLGHDVHLCSTNGYDRFPKELEGNVSCRNCLVNAEDKVRTTAKCTLEKNYDMTISYTMMINFGKYLQYSSKNRFGIWNYDGTNIPNGYGKYYKLATKVLPSSNFSKQTFLGAGVPNDMMVVIPHGVNDNFLTNTSTYNVKSNRKKKVLVNIAQSHARKNISGILEAWGKAFTNKDDVVMVAKVKKTKPIKKWEVSWQDEVRMFRSKFKDHAPIIEIDEYLDDISDLYRGVDVIFSASHVECFLLPALEGLCSNKIVIASNWGGNVDFMNENNSLLIDGKIGRAPHSCQYWEDSVNGSMFYPDTDHAAELLQKSIREYDSLIEKFQPGMDQVKKTYTWKNVTNQILSLCE